MKAKKKLKRTYVCIRVTLDDRKQIKQAAKKVNSKWLTFIRTSTLEKASLILNG